MALSLAEIDDVLDALCTAAEFCQLAPAWIPCLRACLKTLGNRRVRARALQDLAEKPVACRPGALTGRASALTGRVFKHALSDPDDKPLLQLAVEARVPIIVTRNTRHLQPAETFGIKLLTPAEFLATVREIV